MATPADWAVTIAADAAADGCDATLSHSAASHTRKAITMFDKDGNVAEQSAIDIFTNGHVTENLYDSEDIDP
jgi:hypothetical protein